jgi:hypothetical protein
MFQPILPINLSPFTNSNIRQRLIDAIGSELGEYSQGIPAFYFVTNPDTDPPKSYRTNRLECLIFAPIPSAASPLHHNAIVTESWEVRLIQRDRKKTCLAAYSSILAKYPDVYLSSHLRANRDVDVQINLSISQIGIIQ